MTPQSFNTLDSMQENHSFEKTVRQSLDNVHQAQTNLKMPQIDADQYGNATKPVPEEQFLLAINGQQQGPYTKDQISAMIRMGQITVDTLLWRSGLIEWTPIKNYPGII